MRTNKHSMYVLVRSCALAYSLTHSLTDDLYTVVRAGRPICSFFPVSFIFIIVFPRALCAVLYFFLTKLERLTKHGQTVSSHVFLPPSLTLFFLLKRARPYERWRFSDTLLKLRAKEKKNSQPFSWLISVTANAYYSRQKTLPYPPIYSHWIVVCVEP